MGSAGQNEGTFHALLIGIDNYPIKPLGGCVNDIGAIERILLESGLGVTAGSIRRLASPLATASHVTKVKEDAATLANITAALADLASERIKDTDRVFIYFSGHGKRVPFTSRDGQVFQREALVPVDFVRGDNKYEWLLDFQFNTALRRIVARTRNVTVLLDCCHAAGSFRDGDDLDSTARSLDELELAPVPDPAYAGRGSDDDAAWLGRGIEACHVVSACLAHESAREATLDGERHGLLTRAFIGAISAVAPTERPQLSWARIWYAMRAQVVRGNQFQTPQMEGNARRLVFSGPPISGDAGIAVTCDAAGVYHLEAGSMAEVTEGTELAIYGLTPAYFPELGSDTDLQERAGVVRVNRATPDAADARAIDTTFSIQTGSRARVIKPATVLLCSVRPRNPEIEQAVAESALVKIVGPDEPAAVRFERHGDQWLLVDDEHGNGQDAPILFGLAATALSDARPVLEHYATYSLPIRIAKRAVADMPDGLELRVLDCPEDIASEDSQDPKLNDVKLDKASYRVKDGAGVCFRVRNRTRTRLHVGLVDSAAGGGAYVLGDATIEPGQFHVFWSRRGLGKPFWMRLDNGAPRARDRIVAIGRTTAATTLDYLDKRKSFTEAIADWRRLQASRGDELDGRGIDDGTRELVLGNAAAATQRWTAAHAVIEISA